MKGIPPFTVYTDRRRERNLVGIVDAEGNIIVSAHVNSYRSMQLLAESLTANPKLLIPISKCPKCEGGMFGGKCGACDITKIKKVKK